MEPTSVTKAMIHARVPLHERRCRPCVARRRIPGRDLVEALLTLPLDMPPTVLGY
jgi:ABC-type molybdate transport system permease subunit